MWPWTRPEPWLCELHASQLQLRPPGGAATTKTLPWSPQLNAAGLVELLRETIGSLSAPLSLRLAGPLAVHWLQPPLRGSASLTDWQLAVQQRASALMDGRACWTVANWDARQPFLCGAADAGWTQALRERWKGPLQLGTYWLDALAAHLHLAPTQGWLGLRGVDSLLLSRHEGRRLLGLLEIPMQAEDEERQSSAMAVRRMRQLAAREDWPEPGEKRWIDLRAEVAQAELESGWQRLAPAASWNGLEPST